MNLHRQTGRQCDSYMPPNSVRGGYKNTKLMIIVLSNVKYHYDPTTILTALYLLGSLTSLISHYLGMI